MRAKKGFTLMELLVSIFITGMVMLALVAMWKTSSTQTAEAQRQSIIKNESTIFLRRVYSDFVSASEIICPKGHSSSNYTCPQASNTAGGTYIAVKHAVISSDTAKLIRISSATCGNGSEWGTDGNFESMRLSCIQPSYIIYVFEGNTGNGGNIYRCQYNTEFLESNSEINISNIVNDADDKCLNDTDREMIMPYVISFSLGEDGLGAELPELLVDYTVKREFGNDIPPVYFKFKRYLTRKGGA